MSGPRTTHIPLTQLGVGAEHGQGTPPSARSGAPATFLPPAALPVPASAALPPLDEPVAPPFVAEFAPAPASKTVPRSPPRELELPACQAVPAPPLARPATA